MNKKQLYIEVRSVNKLLTDEYLDTLTERQVIGHIHPLYRQKILFDLGYLE